MPYFDCIEFENGPSKELLITEFDELKLHPNLIRNLKLMIGTPTPIQATSLRTGLQKHDLIINNFFGFDTLFCITSLAADIAHYTDGGVKMNRPLAVFVVASVSSAYEIESMICKISPIRTEVLKFFGVEDSLRSKHLNYSFRSVIVTTPEHVRRIMNSPRISFDATKLIVVCQFEAIVKTEYVHEVKLLCKLGCSEKQVIVTTSCATLSGLERDLFEFVEKPILLKCRNWSYDFTIRAPLIERPNEKEEPNYKCVNLVCDERCDLGKGTLFLTKRSLMWFKEGGNDFHFELGYCKLSDYQKLDFEQNNEINAIYVKLDSNNTVFRVRSLDHNIRKVDLHFVSSSAKQFQQIVKELDTRIREYKGIEIQSGCDLKINFAHRPVAPMKVEDGERVSEKELLASKTTENVGEKLAKIFFKKDRRRR